MSVKRVSDDGDGAETHGIQGFLTSRTFSEVQKSVSLKKSVSSSSGFARESKSTSWDT
jgi:hypothetical protein